MMVEKEGNMANGVDMKDMATTGEQGDFEEKVKFLPSEEKVGLKKQVGFVGAICLIVGCMIGSGIFASPGLVIKQSGSMGMALIVWTGCGLLACLAALSYCELGTMFHHLGGGEHTYIYQAFGPCPSFLFDFTALLVIKPTSLAGISMACGYYIMEPTGNQEMIWRKLIAAGVIGKLILSVVVNSCCYY